MQFQKVCLYGLLMNSWSFLAVSFSQIGMKYTLNNTELAKQHFIHLILQNTTDKS